MTTMIPSAFMACFWVVASAGVACLPMRRQYVPGVALLLAAPVLRWPVLYLARWLRGLVKS